MQTKLKGTKVLFAVAMLITFINKISNKFSGNQMGNLWQMMGYYGLFWRFLKNLYNMRNRLRYNST